MITLLRRYINSIRGVYYSTRTDIYAVLNSVFRIQPNKIVFNNFNGRGYGDNPKYIASEIIRRKLPYDLVWIVADENIELPSQIRKVKAGSFKCSYELSTAKVFINNVKNKLPFIKKKGQYYIQTWHGSFTLKLIEKEAEALLPPKYVAQSKKDSAKTDVILSGSSMLSDVIRESFWFSGEIFNSGQPRDDIYFNTTADEIAVIKKKLGIPLGVKILIYAPTFRDNGVTSVYNIDLDALNSCLEDATGEKWISLVRLHPNVKNHRELFDYNDNVINVSDISDSQELFLVSDMLISDYSSAMIDFAIVKKPVILYVPDLEDYTENSRPIRSIFKEVPFPKCESNSMLLECVKGFKKEIYDENLSVFMSKYYTNYSDGFSSKRVVDRIESVVNQEEL